MAAAKATEIHVFNRDRFRNGLLTGTLSEGCSFEESSGAIGAGYKNNRRTVSVSVETVIVIVSVDTVVELVTAGAVILIDTVREIFIGQQRGSRCLTSTWS